MEVTLERIEAVARYRAAQANYTAAREDAARALGALDAARERYARASAAVQRHEQALDAANRALYSAGRVVEERCLPVPPYDPAARGEMF